MSPYRDDYESIANIPIVHAATAWQSPVTGQTYILVLNKVLWMGKHIDHTLINPNQLCHYGTSAQDDPTSARPLSIITEDKSFCMELTMQGTIIFAETYSPTNQELDSCPHINLSSNASWNPHTVTFPACQRSLEEEIDGFRYISASVTNNQQLYDDEEQDVRLFNLNRITRRISSITVIKPAFLRRNTDIDPCSTDIPLTSSFTSSDQHSDVTPKDLSKRWDISTSTAAQTLKKTTQKFLRSAILPLGRRYRTDRIFTRKTLSSDWSTNKIDGRCKSLEGNKYAQVFANKGYFFHIYPMNSKKKAGDALRLFCQEFGVPERFTFDRSKEQTMKGSEFMKQIRTHNIDYHISEADLHNQNFCEGVIRELRCKWYCMIIKQRVPQQF